MTNKTMSSGTPSIARSPVLLRKSRSWARFALQTPLLSRRALYSTIFKSLRCSIRHRTGTRLAVPFKLEDTHVWQHSLRMMQGVDAPRACRLIYAGSLHCLIVHCGSRPLGVVPKSHGFWAAPLILLGMELRFVRVTEDVRSGRLGCVVAAWEVDRMLQRYRASQ